MSMNIYRHLPAVCRDYNWIYFLLESSLHSRPFQYKAQLKREVITSFPKSLFRITWLNQLWGFQYRSLKMKLSRGLQWAGQDSSFWLSESMMSS